MAVERTGRQAGRLSICKNLIRQNDRPIDDLNEGKQDYENSGNYVNYEDYTTNHFRNVFDFENSDVEQIRDAIDILQQKLIKKNKRPINQHLICINISAIDLTQALETRNKTTASGTIYIRLEDVTTDADDTISNITNNLNKIIDKTLNLDDDTVKELLNMELDYECQDLN